MCSTCLCVIVSISHFGFRGQEFGFDCIIPGHCLVYDFKYKYSRYYVLTN